MDLKTLYVMIPPWDWPEDTGVVLQLLYSDDDDIVDAVHEALGMLEGGRFDDAIDDEDDW